MAYKTQSRDTNFKVERLLIEAYRRMTPHEKAKKISQLSQGVYGPRSCGHSQSVSPSR